jgi:hypothetical protein
VPQARHDDPGIDPIEPHERDDPLQSVAQHDQDPGADVEAQDRAAEHHGADTVRCDLGDRADDQAAEGDADEVGLLDLQMVQHVEHLQTDGLERVRLAAYILQEPGRRTMAAQVDQQDIEDLPVAAQLSEPDRGTAARAMHEDDPVAAGIEYVGPVVEHRSCG